MPLANQALPTLALAARLEIFRPLLPIHRPVMPRLSILESVVLPGIFLPRLLPTLDTAAVTATNPHRPPASPRSSGMEFVTLAQNPTGILSDMRSPVAKNAP